MNSMVHLDVEIPTHRKGTHGHESTTSRQIQNIMSLGKRNSTRCEDNLDVNKIMKVAMGE